MATIETGSLLLHFLLGVFLLSPEGGVVSLELLPSTPRVVLERSSSYSVVCSGWSHVTWALPGDSQVGGVAVDAQGSTSVLSVSNATWRQSGRYTCSEADSDQTRTLDLFVPGSGSSEWFLPSPESTVMRRSRTWVIPCSVSDPSLTVELWERSGSLRVPVVPVRFDPVQGFTAALNDSSYVCSAQRGQQEALSQVYYVFSIVGPEELQVELWSSGVVLKKGEPLIVNCTVTNSENIYFTWDYPRKHSSNSQELEPLTEFLSNQVRSFINISEATPQDSGVYVCSVEESTHKQTAERSLNITVLSRGFLDLSSSESGPVQTLLHHTVVLSVHIRAFPPPNVTWTTPDSSHIVTTATSNSSITTATATPAASASTSRLSQTRFVSVLTLEKVQLNQTGSYIATVSNDDDVKEVEFTLEVKAPPRIRSLSEVGVASVLCVSEGAPPPQLTWFTCPLEFRCSDEGWSNLSESDGASVKENSTDKHGLTQVHSVLSLKSLTSVSSVRCESKNLVGRRAWDLRLVSSSLWSQVKVLVAVLVLVVLAVIFLILLIILWRKKPRLGLGWRLVDSVSPDGLQVSYVDPAELPYDAVWEIPRETVRLGTVVSSGTFGRILEASVLDLVAPNSSTKATVKTLKGGAALQSLLSDLKVQVQVGPHLNLLNLLGACTKDGRLMVISEWSPHGDLASYLKRHKHTFVTGHAHDKSESDGYMDMTSQESQYVAMKQLCVQQQPEYEILHNTSAPDLQGAPCDSEDLSLSDLLSFSFQTACAMDFLSQRNCVHRDLGARNVLVSEGKLLKICDFGLGRNLNKSRDYVQRGNGYSAVKWMSPESIFHCVYTLQSDVWSYGVLLWEIFSLGEPPYPEVPVTQFYSDLKNGRRLERPDLAPSEMFELMSRCWEQSPESRPTFSSLVDSVGKLLPPPFHQRYSSLTEQFLSDPTVTRTRTRTRTTPGPDQDPAVPQVTVHLSGEEPQRAGPAHSDDITTESEITAETRGDAALDAEEDKDQEEDRPSLLQEQEVMSSGQEESCF